MLKINRIDGKQLIIGGWKGIIVFIGKSDTQFWHTVSHDKKGLKMKLS